MEALLPTTVVLCWLISVSQAHNWCSSNQWNQHGLQKLINKLCIQGQEESQQLYAPVVHKEHQPSYIKMESEEYLPSYVVMEHEESQPSSVPMVYKEYRPSRISVEHKKYRPSYVPIKHEEHDESRKSYVPVEYTQPDESRPSFFPVEDEESRPSSLPIPDKEHCENGTKPDFDTKNHMLQLVFKLIQNCTDEDVVLVRTWMNYYKSLLPEQKMHTRKAIQQILFEGLMGALHSNSIVINSRVCTALSMKAHHQNIPIYFDNNHGLDAAADGDDDADALCTVVCKAHYRAF